MIIVILYYLYNWGFYLYFRLPVVTDPLGPQNPQNLPAFNNPLQLYHDSYPEDDSRPEEDIEEQNNAADEEYQ